MSLPAPSRSDVVLSVRKLSVSYEAASGPVNAVSDMSLDLVAGEIMGVIGESGSGKSTLGRALLGMLPHTGRVTSGSASLRVDGRTTDLLAVAPRQLRALRGEAVALIPQATASALDPVSRIGAQFDQTYRAHGRRDSERNRAEALGSLHSVGLNDPERVMRMYPHELSGGMAQRVVVALAAALEPTVLVADEPTSALDVTVQKRLLDNLARTIRSTGRACLLITHDLGVVANYCDRVMVMYGGYGVEFGSVADVLHRPSHPFTVRLMESVPGRRPRHVARSRMPAEVGVDLEDSLADEHCPYVRVCGPRADPRCALEMPDWRQVSGEHEVRSFCGPETRYREDVGVVGS